MVLLSAAREFVSRYETGRHSMGCRGQLMVGHAQNLLELGDCLDGCVVSFPTEAEGRRILRRLNRSPLGGKLDGISDRKISDYVYNVHR